MPVKPKKVQKNTFQNAMPKSKRVKHFTHEKPVEEKKFQKRFKKENEFSKSPSHEKPVEEKKFQKRIKKEKELFIWGKRPIEGYLTNLHTQENIDNTKYIIHIIVDKTNKAPVQLKPIVESAKVLGIKIISHSSAEGTWPLAGSEDLNHQRVCLKVPEFPVGQLQDILKLLKENTQNIQSGCVGLVLDQIQDPRNFGAILRSAAFFGVKFVLFATDRQAEITGLVLKTSAGGAFSINLVPVVNINRALIQLKENGAWIVGASLQENSIELKNLPKDRGYVLVLGNEEKGLRSEVTKNCDYLVKLKGGQNGVDSLNVSVAAGVFIHSLQP